MMGVWLGLAAAARADAGPEEDEGKAPEATAEAAEQMPSRPEHLQASEETVLPVARPRLSALPLCPDHRASCRTFCTVAEPTSVLWDGLLERDVSGPAGLWRKKRGRG